jgi:hypothetical protein
MRWAIFVISTLMAFWATAFADSPPPEPMSHETRMLVIRSLSSELAFARHTLPQGTKGVTVKDRKIVDPSEAELDSMVANFGAAVKPGDRVQITRVDIKDNRVVLELNGGPKKKGKWYQHIEVSGMGGAVTPGGPPPDQSTHNPHGSVIVLLFDTKFVPEMTGNDVRDLLAPVLDFNAKSATEAYLETIPPKVKEAIKNHQILVGMNHEMVTYAKGRPEKKIREKGQDGKDYEEWLYGAPPQEVQFVRFEGDEVVRLEIMPVNGDKIVRTEKEVDLKTVVAQKQPEPQPPAPTKAPSLRLPGEQPEEPQKPLPRGSVPQEEGAPPIVLPPSPPTQAPGAPPQ